MVYGLIQTRLFPCNHSPTNKYITIGHRLKTEYAADADVSNRTNCQILVCKNHLTKLFSEKYADNMFRGYTFIFKIELTH